MPLSFSCEQEDSLEQGELKAPLKKDQLNSSEESLEPSKNASCAVPLLSMETGSNPKLSGSKQVDKEQGIKHIFIAEEREEDGLETTALHQHRDSDQSDSMVESTTQCDNYLTLSGTIKRGKKKGQNIDVVLNMSREELEVLEAAITNDKRDVKKLTCSGDYGVHVMLWSVVCIPLSFLLSAFYSFGMGTVTWYNVFIYWTEEKPIWCRILVSPWLILLYPFMIVFLAVGLGLYASLAQVSLHWDAWFKEFVDFEKGFYGWLCNVIDLPDCAPYQVVVLSGIQTKA